MGDSSQWVPLATASISAGSNTANTKRIIKAQTAENEKMRQYNAEQARLQNEWNLQQWQRENAALKAATESERGYNSPAAQKARMVAAGLNPDMMYGGSGSVATSPAAGVASSPSAVGSSYGDTVDWSLLSGANPVGQFASSYLDNQYKQALIDNVNADTEKKGHETSILSSDASFRDAWNTGLLATQNVDIRVKEKDIQLNDQLIKESQSKIRSMDASTAKIGEEIISIRNAVQNDNARLDLEKAFSAANIEQCRANTNLTQEQAKRYAAELEKVIRQYNDKHALDEQTLINLGHDAQLKITQNGIVEFESNVRTRQGYQEDMTYWQNVLMFFEQICSSFGSLIHK